MSLVIGIIRRAARLARLPLAKRSTQRRRKYARDQEARPTGSRKRVGPGPIFPAFRLTDQWIRGHARTRAAPPRRRAAWPDCKGCAVGERPGICGTHWPLATGYAPLLQISRAPKRPGGGAGTRDVSVAAHTCPWLHGSTTEYRIQREKRGSEQGLQGNTCSLPCICARDACCIDVSVRATCCEGDGRVASAGRYAAVPNGVATVRCVGQDSARVPGQWIVDQWPWPVEGHARA